MPHAPNDASLCVRLALAEAGLAYEMVLVDRSRQAKSSPGNLGLNLIGLRSSRQLSDPARQRGPGRPPFSAPGLPVRTLAKPARSQTHPKEVRRDAGFDAGSFPTPRAA